jgi:hypothetical protein
MLKKYLFLNYYFFVVAAYVEFLHNFESYSQSQNQHHTHFHNHLNQIHHQHLQSQQQAEEEALSGAACTDAEAQRRQFRQERSQTLHNPGTAVSCGFPRGPPTSPPPPCSTSHHHLNSGMFSPTEESPTHCNKYYQLEQQFSPCGSEGHPQSPGAHIGLLTFEDRENNGNNGVPPALPPKKSKNFLKSESSDDRGSCCNSPLCDGVGVHTHVLSCSPPSSVAESSSSPSRQIPIVTTPVHTSTK